jgi:hypothetical protein
MPTNNRACLTTSSGETEMTKFCYWAKDALSKGILEFKGHGKDGELLHDLFDQVMVQIEMDKGLVTIDVYATWHTNESLKDTFWQCFYAATLSAEVEYGQLKIVCADLSGINRSNELVNYLKESEIEKKMFTSCRMRRPLKLQFQNSQSNDLG